MFDGLKLRVSSERDQRRLRDHPRLDFVPDRTGRFQARWGHLRLIGDEIRCWEIRGSFHHLHHGNNATDFLHGEFVQVVTDFCLDLGLHASTLMLTNLEVGVNIVPSVPTRQALQQIILHRTKHATGMGRGAVGIEFRHAMYLIKIYDKALHANVEGEILRFEVAVKKMRELEMFNIRTLHDLFEVSVWADMRTYLLRRFDELFIAEPEVPLHGLRPAQRMLVELGRDPQRLIGLDPRRRWEKLRVLRRIYARHATSSLRAELRAAIEAKATAVGPPMGAHCRVVGPALGGAGARGAYLG